MRIARWILIFAAIAVVYSLTYSYRPITDTRLNSYQTQQLALHGNVDISEYKPLGGYYVHRGTDVYSIYGIGISLFALPFYSVLLRFHASQGLLQGSVSIFYAAIAATFMLATMLRLVPRRIAVAAALVFAFGTTLWPTGTTALWQHAPVVALETIGLWAIVRERRLSPFLAGLAFGAAAWIRLPVGVVAIAFLAYFATKGLRAILLYLAGVAPLVVARIVEDVWLWGGVTRTGYSYEPDTFTFGHFLRGFWGELFSWRRGLFVYSPIFILAVIGIAFLISRRQPQNALYVFAGLSVLGLIVVNAVHTVWWGGERQFGYRYLIDAAPLLVILVAYALDRLKPLMPIAAFIGVASVVIMAAGSIPNGNSWDTTYPQNELALSSLAHSLHGMVAHPWSGLFRLVLVAAASAVLVLTVGSGSPERAAQTA